jgi:hypothetical protein
LGYEVNRMFNSAQENTFPIAHSPYRHGGRTKYSDMTVYTADSGATVFATGTIQWSWGLDNFNVKQRRAILHALPPYPRLFHIPDFSISPTF